MSTSIITAVAHPHEQELVKSIDSARGITLVRRCADVAELISASASGVADVAVVAPNFRGIDRDALRQLAGHGVRTAGLVERGDDAGESRLRQLGVSVILRPDTPAEEIEDSLTHLAGGATMGVRELSTLISDADVEALLRGKSDPAGPVPDGDPGARGGPGTTGEPNALTSAASSAGWGMGQTPSSGGELPRIGQITAVWGPAGAPGRTTVAVTLASELARRGVRTLLIDFDTWGASVAQTLALIDEAPGVAAAARASEQGTLDRESLARVAPEVGPGLRVLTGLPKPERWPELRAAAVEDILEKARLVADHVVVDCGFAIEDDEELSYDTAAPRRNAATLTTLERSEHLLVVGAADPIGLQRLVRSVQEVSVVPSPQPIVVVNKVRASATGPGPERAITSVLSRFAGLEDPWFIPWAPQECDAALLAGRSLTENAADSPVTRAIRALTPVVRPELDEHLSRANRRAGQGRSGFSLRGRRSPERTGS